MWRVVLGLVMVMVAPARAQVVSLGVHGGVNRTEETNAPVGGVSLELGLGPSFALGAALEYSGRGVSLAQTGGDMVDYRLGYLAAPVAIRIELGRGRVPMHVSAGTTVGALLFATQKRDGMASDARGELSAIDVTADLGGGIGVKLSDRLTLTLDARWSIALVEEEALAVESWRGRNLQLLGGLTFTLNPVAAPAMPMMSTPPGLL